MMNDAVWQAIETQLLQLYALPHNALELRRTGTSPEQAVQKKLEEIGLGLSGVPRAEEFIGPKLFLRVVGLFNRAYAGEWWFDANLLHRLEAAYARIYFHTADRKAALRDMLRELLAISREWNAITEVWALEVPAGERLIGFSGMGAPQKLFGTLPLTEKGNRLLVGRVRQVFFPVKNPLWVKRYRHLGDS